MQEFELWWRAHFGPTCREHEGSSDIYVDVSPLVNGLPTRGDTRRCIFLKLRFRSSSHGLYVEVIDMKTPDLRKRCLRV